MVFARKRSNKKWIFVVFLILLAFVAFVLNTKLFEKNPPLIQTKSDVIYSNLIDPISIEISDESALKDVKVTLFKANELNGEMLINEHVKDNKKSIHFDLKLPKPAYKEKVDLYKLVIEASDSSFWNFFLGNQALKEVKVIIDTKKPLVEILDNSYQIEQGGVGSVVFKASDENLQEVYITTDKDKIFKVTPYVKEGYYAALIPWEATDEHFRAYVVAVDKAGNVNKQRIRYYFTNKKYRVSNIKVSDRFLDGKIEFLAQKYAPKDRELSRLEKFKFVNEDLRASNEVIIHDITSKVPDTMINNFKVNLFKPLKNGQKVADYADHRFYSYNNQAFSSSYHMGLDLASIKEAPIISNNDGEVVFVQENGIYGLNIIIYHGFGIYTLYGHCTNVDVNVGDRVRAGDVIGTTGTTGLALGDHVHFGVLVQGVEVRPEQWQDAKWIKENIYNVLESSKKRILSE
ncbi:M23 family metallopeptidase [Campylobacter lari]|uniref:M23 family metallopeptidase n=1 Tax=Campylobacter lari TaxID=201 RepID=A0A5L8WCR8_CAMLA|nr:M23 family metallopeptidase [Campylobacter lari]EAK9939621.1 M23 family metallopeptidase [Campylobacter lari]EAL4711361.1 M23 family peptidase [Campylobacter lari]MCR2075160.1 M23 family metallopeptidase [Campylobacter lari subsp. concheus]MCR2082865.1 M23 family metallopeptidase [Campylobacter lari subsp. concheus]MCR2084288.1 M23 family metallopeptidase [Campylobacter lari subsp. concheus]